MGRFDEQLRCRKVVLSKISQEKSIRWREIINGTIEATGSSTKSQSSLDWLRKKGHVKRVEIGVYEITTKGTKFLAGLNNTCSPELTGHEELREGQKARRGNVND